MTTATKELRRYLIPIERRDVAKLREHHERQVSAETKHATGGMQNWVRDTYGRLVELDSQTWIEADDLWLGRTYRMSIAYGGGGWEKTLQRILAGVFRMRKK